MKNLIKNSIISQAISLGFDFEQFQIDTKLREINESLIDFFNDNSEKLEQLEDLCEVQDNGRSQYVSYGNYRSDGDIINFADYRHYKSGEKIYHSDFLMEHEGKIKQMNLYCLAD